MHQQYRRNFDHTSNSAHSTDHAVQNDKGMGRENKNPRDLGNTSHTGGKSAKFQHRVSQEMRIRQLEHQCFELSRVLRLSETQHSELQSSATDLQREHSNLLFKHSLAKNGAIDQAQLKATIARQMESHAGEIASLERDLQQGKTQMTALITTQVETEGLLRETTAKFEREQSLNERLALRNRALEKELSSLKSTHVDESEFIKRLEHELKTCQRAHESCPALVHEIDELTQRLKDAGEQKLVDSVRISDLEGEIGENRKEIHKMTLTIEQLQDELETAIESHAGCAAQTKQLNEMRTDFNNSQKKLQELNSELEIKSSQLMDIINTHETVIQQNKQSSHKHEMMEQMIKKLMDYKESDSKQKQFKINTIRRAKRLMNELEADIGASYTKNPKGGLLINKVPKSSEAYRGGLRRGDQVVQLQGREVSSKKECLDLIKQYAIGDSICFQIMQGSEKEKICFVKVGAVGISSHDALQRLRRLAERDDQDFQLNISELEKMKSHSRKGKTGKTKHSSKSESKRAQSVSMMNHIDNPM